MTFGVLNTTLEWLEKMGLYHKDEKNDPKENVDQELLKEREEKHIWY